MGDRCIDNSGNFVYNYSGGVNFCQSQNARIPTQREVDEMIAKNVVTKYTASEPAHSVGFSGGTCNYTTTYGLYVIQYNGSMSGECRSVSKNASWYCVKDLP